MFIVSAKIMQIESNKTQTCLGLLPRCSLSYAKIMEIERKTKCIYYFYSEIQIISCKYRKLDSFVIITLLYI